jgi:hypothetical protein
MRECTKKIIDLFFEPDEQVCVSHNDYGYHSIPQTMLNGAIEQVSPTDGIENEYINETDICLMSINPVKGFRRDSNVTAFRSFMVELDDGALSEQMAYIKKSKLPYSICTFSGNKSLHFGIVLEQELPSEDIWRDIAEWILNILPKADQVAKNPTRSIRFPHNMRPNGKKQMQKLLEFNGRVKYNELAKWLQKHPELNPAEQRKHKKASTPRAVNGIPQWVLDKLANGIDEDKGRNNEWFGIAMELAKSGFDGDQIIAYTEEFFTPDRDFGEREWKTIMKHAYKRAQRQS